MRDARTTKKHAAEVDPKPPPSVLDGAEIKYAATCHYCKSKQKIIALSQPTHYYRHTALNLCATCLMTAATYLMKFRKEE